jgi:hypothetical protein
VLEAETNVCPIQSSFEQAPEGISVSILSRLASHNFKTASDPPPEVRNRGASCVDDENNTSDTTSLTAFTYDLKQYSICDKRMQTILK